MRCGEMTLTDVLMKIFSSLSSPATDEGLHRRQNHWGLTHPLAVSVAARSVAVGLVRWILVVLVGGGSRARRRCEVDDPFDPLQLRTRYLRIE